MYSVLKMYFDVINRFLSQNYFNVFFFNQKPRNFIYEFLYFMGS